MCEINENKRVIRDDSDQEKAVWNQIALKCKDKLLVVCDHGGGIVENHPPRTGFRAQVAAQEIVSNAPRYSLPLPREIHVIAHTEEAGQEALFKGFFKATATGRKVVVLHVAKSVTTIEAAYQKPDSGGDFVWLPMRDRGAYERVELWLNEFLELPVKKAEKLAAFKSRAAARDYEKDFSHLLDIILPGNAENELALELLAAAWNATPEILADAERASLKINRPTTKSAWFNPFQESSGFQPNAEQIAARMMTLEAKTAAKALLKEVEERAAGETIPPDQADIRTKADEFLATIHKSQAETKS